MSQRRYYKGYKESQNQKKQMETTEILSIEIIFIIFM